MTWSVTDGGRLCTCGHMKCQHEAGKGYCAECEEVPNYKFQPCKQFVDRVPEAA